MSVWTNSYEIRAEPLTHACHCKECQKQSSSAFGMSMPVLVTQLSFSRTTETMEGVSDSGREVSCLFCGECGTRLFHNPAETPKLPMLNLEHWMIPVGSSLLATCGLEVLKMGCSGEQMLNYEATELYPTV